MSNETPPSTDQARLEFVRHAVSTFEAALIRTGITLQSEVADMMVGLESSNLSEEETKEIVTGYVRERMVGLMAKLEPDRRRMYEVLMAEGLLHDIDASELEAL